jgi:hypothetical protein
MATLDRVIYLHAQAPSKPAPGAPCNGCGVCCAVEPCPLGMLLSRSRKGACKALQWDAAGSRYRCGVVVEPAAYLRGLPAGWARRLASRWIAAGRGCDSNAEVG